MFNLTEAIKARIEDYSQEAKQAAEQKCTEADEFVNRATENNDSQMIMQAIDIYAEALNIFPKLIRPYLTIANIYKWLGKISEANKILDIALEIEPANQDIHSLLKYIQEDAKLTAFQIDENYQNTPIVKIKAKLAESEGIIDKMSEVFSFESEREDEQEQENLEISETEEEDSPNEYDFSDDFNASKKSDKIKGFEKYI